LLHAISPNLAALKGAATLARRSGILLCAWWAEVEEMLVVTAW